MAPHLSWRGAPTSKKEVDCGRLGKSGGYYGRQAWNICHSYLKAAMNSYYQREKRRQKEEIRSHHEFLCLSCVAKSKEELEWSFGKDLSHSNKWTHLAFKNC